MITNTKRMCRVGLLFPLALVLSLAGCQSDSLEMDRTLPHDKTITIQATYEVPDIETKSIRDDAGKIYWTPGDAISLFYGSGTNGGSKFVALTEEVSLTTNFSGTITAVTGGADIDEGDTYFWGLYPYDENASCDGQTITMSIPSVQTGMEDTFAPGFAPSLGHSQGLMLSFRNIWSGFGFTVSEAGYQSVTFRGNNGESLAGRAKIGVDDKGAPYVVQILDGIKEVTLNAPDASGFVPGKYYYMQFFPINLTSGFTVEVSSFTQTGTYIYTDSMEYTRSSWKRAKNVDTRCTSFTERNITRADFEDEHFANYVFKNFDNDQDGKLSLVERDRVTYIRVRTDTVASVQGIEFFANLAELDCNGVASWNNETQQNEYGKLTSINLSGNPKLQYPYCNYNRLTSLNLSNNRQLTYLACNENLLTNLDVSANPALTQLICSYNQFSSLDLSNNPELKYLQAHGLGLTSLDLSHNPKLTSLYCSSNSITSLDTSQFPGMSELDLSYNPLESFDISHNPELVYLNCDNLSLAALDVSHLPKLERLYCRYNQLSTLDLSHNPKLRYLYADRNSLTELDLSGNPVLYYLYCRYNMISNLELSENAALRNLYCYSNQLTVLDVSGIASLYYLDARNNPLSTLYVTDGQTIQYEYLPEGVSKVVRQLEGMAIDATAFPDPEFRAWVSANCDPNGDGKLTKPERLAVTDISVNTDAVASLEGIGYFKNLSSLYCTGSIDWNTMEKHGLLTSLDLSENTMLTRLYCYYNASLSSLDLSKNVNLQYADLGYNNLSTLILPSGDQLKTVYCYNNALTSIDATKSSGLQTLYCGDNQLSVLDLSNCPDLQSLECYSNPFTSLDLSGNKQLTYLYSSDCSSLQTLKLPETLLSIRDWAFGNCTSLKQVVIPASVISIASQAFYWCSSLESITIKAATPPTGGDRMFYGSTCPIYVPATSVDAYKAAQYWADYADRIQARGSGDNEGIGYDEW